MAQSDRPPSSQQEFWIIPWDMDGTFPDPQTRVTWSGGRPDWDEPV